MDCPILSRLNGKILPRCENTTFLTISIFDVLPNKIHYRCSFALPAGFVIVSDDMFRNNEIKIDFNGEILTLFCYIAISRGAQIQ